MSEQVKGLYEPDRPGNPAHSEVHTVHEAEPNKTPVLYLPNGTPLVREKPPVGFKK